MGPPCQVVPSERGEGVRRKVGGWEDGKWERTAGFAGSFFAYVVHGARGEVGGEGMVDGLFTTGTE